MSNNRAIFYDDTEEDLNCRFDVVERREQGSTEFDMVDTFTSLKVARDLYPDAVVTPLAAEKGGMDKVTEEPEQCCNGINSAEESFTLSQIVVAYTKWEKDARLHPEEYHTAKQDMKEDYRIVAQGNADTLHRFLRSVGDID